MSDSELALFVTAFESSGVNSSINWYRNVDRMPNVSEIELDCGHRIMDEMPDETNRAILTWLERQAVTSVAV